MISSVNRSLVIGWYRRGNCGDDAFVEAFQSLLPGSELTFATPNMTELRGANGVVVPAHFDRVILGGGDVIKDYYLRQVPKDVALDIVGCGVGYESEMKQLADRRVGRVLLRNQADVTLASKAGVAARYVPDICFGIPPEKWQERGAASNIYRGGRKKRLGVILSAHPQSGTGQPKQGESAYFDYLQWELASTLDHLVPYYSVHWISFSVDPDAWDEGVGYLVRRKMQNRGDQFFAAYEADRPLDQLALLSKMDLVLTMKFHGAIFSAIAGVPFISMGLTRKLTQFCEQEDLTDFLVAPYTFRKAVLVEQIRAAEAPGVKERLANIALKNCAAVEEAFKVFA